MRNVSQSLISMLLAAAGCRTVFTTAAYLIKGTNVDAEYEGLREKRVVVVCRPVAASCPNRLTAPR